MQSILPKITKNCLYLLVFLLPLFWLPFSFENFEFNKQYLLFFLTGIAFFSWLIKMVLVDSQLKFRKTAFDIFVGAFLLIGILSAIFSVDKSSSIFGFYGRFADSLVALLSFGAFYFLLVNAKCGIENKKLIKIFLLSSGLVVLTAYFSIFGIWAKFSFLPQVMRQKIFNPIAGSLEGLAVFISAVVVLLVAMIIGSSQNLNSKPKTKNKKTWLYCQWFLLLLSSALLIIIDFNAAWLALMLSLSVFLGFSFWKRIFKNSANKLLLPFILVIISVIGLSFDFSPVKGLAKEQVLDKSVSWEVAFKGATDSVKKVFLGSGIGTFHYDFSREKPQDFNQNRFWQIRFDRPSSYLAEVLGTMGFLGLLSWLALIGVFLFISYFLLLVENPEIRNPKQKNSEFEIQNFKLPILMAILALIFGQIFYYQNTVLSFSFWLFIALGSLAWEKGVSEKTFSLKKIPELGLAANVILSVIGLGFIVFIYFGSRFYLADVAFANKEYEKAVKFNPYNSQYWTMLAKSYFKEAERELLKPSQEADKDYLQNRIALAIDSGKQAAARGPGQVAAFESLAIIYRDIEIFAGGAQDWAAKYFQEAVELEPTNPVLRIELAKILKEPEQSKKELQAAISLKPDYLEALLLEAIFEERLGDLDEAVAKMERLSLQFPMNIEVLFQLGRIYFNANKEEEAISQLEKVLILAPSHSNSLYTLGTIYQKKKDNDRAKEYFEKVLELNPGNAEIENKLEELK